MKENSNLLTKDGDPGSSRASPKHLKPIRKLKVKHLRPIYRRNRKHFAGQSSKSKDRSQVRKGRYLKDSSKRCIQTESLHNTNETLNEHSTTEITFSLPTVTGMNNSPSPQCQGNLTTSTSKKTKDPYLEPSLQEPIHNSCSSAETKTTDSDDPYLTGESIMKCKIPTLNEIDDYFESSSDSKLYSSMDANNVEAEDE